VLVGVTGLVDWIGNRVGDDPPPPPPSRIDARVMAVEQRGGEETLGDYVRETKPAGARYTAAQLRESGLVFAVRVRIRGAQGQKLPLRWSFYEVGGGRVRGPVYNQVGVVFAPLAREHARTWPVWVPQPPRDGRYFVRFTLDDPEGRPVDTKDTPPLRAPHAR